MLRYNINFVCIKIICLQIIYEIQTTQTLLYISDKMTEVEVQKIKINVGLQINTHNVDSVEINDHTNLICNCSKGVFVYFIYQDFILQVISMYFRSISHYVSLSVLVSDYSLILYQSVRVAVGRQFLRQATSI